MVVSPSLKDGMRWHQLARQAALLIGMLMSGGNLIIPRIPLLIIGLALIFLIRGPLLGARREMWPVAVLLAVIFLVSTLLGVAIGSYVDIAIRYANFIMGLGLLALYIPMPVKTLTDDLRPMLKLMAWQCVLTVLVHLAIPGLFYTYTVRAGDAAHHTFLGLFNYHNLFREREGTFVRPNGFFWEPGVFQIYLNVFLFISLFYSRRLKDIVLAVVAVAATQSTVGLGTMIFLVGGAYIVRFKIAGNIERFIVGLLAPIVASALLIFAYQSFTQKSTGEARGSAWAREHDFRTGLNIIGENPFFGVGLDPDRYREASRRLAWKGSKLSYAEVNARFGTNGLAYLIGTLGIPLSIPFLIGMFRQSFFSRTFLFGGLMILSFIGQALILTPFFLMIIFSGLLARRRRGLARSSRLNANPA